MRRILKFSPYVLVFVVGFSIWFLINYGDQSWFTEELKLVLALIPTLLIGFWQLGINDFLYHELKEHKTKYHKLILILGIVYCLFVVMISLIDYQSDANNGFIDESYGSMLIALILSVPISILLIIRIKWYMYERSLWWLIIEMIFPVVGILTLSPSLLREKDELEIARKESID